MRGVEPLLLLAVLLGAPFSFVFAQSDGSVPRDSLGGSASVDVLTPAAQEPAVSAPRPTSTPVTPRPTNPVPAAQSSTPVELSPVPEPTNTEPTPPASNSLLYMLVGAVIAVLIGFGVLKAFSSKSENKEGGERCAPLKTKLEQKKVELVSVEGQIALQQKVVDALSEKLQEKVKDVAKEKVVEALGAEAQAAKAVYDDIQEKYEQAKKALDLFLTTKKQLSGEVVSLEIAYAACKGGVAAALGGGLEIKLPEGKAKVTLYNVVSADGYIAHRDGSEDFIPDEYWPQTLEIFKKYDTLVMGRKSYDAMQKYSSALLAPFEALKIKKVVVSRDEHFVPKPGYGVIRSIDAIGELGGRVLVCSGPEINNALYKADLVGKHIMETVPVTLGEGIKPFDKNLYP